MSETITVEIPLDVAKAYVAPGLDASLGAVKQIIQNALPPEYPDGTYAWVTGDDGTGLESRWLLFRDDGVWTVRAGGARWLADHAVTKVEVLKVAVKGEIVVPSPAFGKNGLNYEADFLSRYDHNHAASFLRQVAQRL